MVLDYCERRPVSKNRPKKQPVGFFVFFFAGALLVSFGIGVATGWLLFRQSKPKQAAPQQTVVTAGQRPASAPLPATQGLPAGQDVPLTFYQTLPHGGTAVIGSGLNPEKNNGTGKTPRSQGTAAAQSQQKAPALETGPAGRDARAVSPDEASRRVEPSTDQGNATKKQHGANATFCVQVASSKDKKDAEAVKARLSAKGLAVYIVESKLQDKGVWFRVRIGKHMEQSEANELAAKAGKGAIVIPE